MFCMKPRPLLRLVMMVVLTVAVIVGLCDNLKTVRDKYFTCGSLKELFENVDATTVIDFIKEINFYHLV